MRPGDRVRWAREYLLEPWPGADVILSPGTGTVVHDCEAGTAVLVLPDEMEARREAFACFEDEYEDPLHACCWAFFHADMDMEEEPRYADLEVIETL